MPGKAGTPETRATGQAGEDLAALYLQRHGCAILARNWRDPHAPGEIDIVASCPDSGDESTLLFVEVRTRRGRPGLAEETIVGRKAEAMLAAAFAYIQAHALDPDTTQWRIDLVAVALDRQGRASMHWAQGVLGD